jgi:hypothetical protein
MTNPYESTMTDIIIMPRKKPDTLLEIAEQAVEDARDRFECARIELQGAEERLRIVREHEDWMRQDGQRWRRWSDDHG